MPNIYGYIDYRKYLLDFITEKKSVNPKYSCRLLSTRLGISAATLVRILNGTRNLSSKLLPIFIEYLKLREKSAEYFSLMVQLANVKGSEGKNMIYQKLLDFRSERIKQVYPQHYSIFEKWYLVALREIIDIKGDIKDINMLSECLRPPVSKKETERAISILQNLKMINEGQNGRFYASEKLLTTGEKWENVAVQKYQGEMMHLANNALMKFSKDERDISTLTIGISSEDILRVKEILRRTRQEILALAEDSKKRDFVYQLNFQFFPVSNCINEAQINDK